MLSLPCVVTKGCLPIGGLCTETSSVRPKVRTVATAAALIKRKVRKGVVERDGKTICFPLCKGSDGTAAIEYAVRIYPEKFNPLKIHKRWMKKPCDFSKADEWKEKVVTAPNVTVFPVNE